MVNTLLLVLVFILMLALLYVILNYKLVKTVDKVFNESYQNRIQHDIQEFYREMESYSSLLENKIQRFKKLLERQDSNLVRWNDIFQQVSKSKKGKQINEFIESSLAKEQLLLQTLATLRTDSEKAVAQAQNNLERNHIIQPKRTPRVQANMATSKPQRKTAQKKAKTLKPSNIAVQNKPVNKVKTNSHFDSNAEKKLESAEGELSVAEELTMALEQGVEPALEKSVEASQTTSTRATSENPSTLMPSTLMKIFSRIGKAVSPVVLGQESTQPEKPIETAKTRPKDSFGQIFSQASSKHPINKITEKITTQKTKPVDVEPKSESTNLESSGNNQTDDQSKQNVTADMVFQMLEDLKEKKKKPMALKLLLNQGFSVEQISEIADMPVSNLEAIKSIYNL